MTLELAPLHAAVGARLEVIVELAELIAGGELEVPIAATYLSTGREARTAA